MDRSNNGYDDDIDDIMASIMGEKNEPSQRQPIARKDVSFTKNKPIERTGIKSRQVKQPHTSHLKKQPQPIRETKSHNPVASEPVLSSSKKPGIKIFTISAIILLLLVVLSGFIYLREPVLSLLKPKAPFSPELSEKSQATLYYPTKLPGSFKMETNSITQSDTGVVLYAITDDGGKKINVSIQKKPDSLNLEPLYSALSNVRDINTKLGTIKVGQSNEGSAELEVSNITVDSSWIILSSAKGTVTDEELNTIISNLSKS